MRTLVKKKFDCICAVDDYDALNVVKNSQHLPDLILIGKILVNVQMDTEDIFTLSFSIDGMIPNMDGYALLKALRSNLKTRMIPVILLSARR